MTKQELIEALERLTEDAAVKGPEAHQIVDTLQNVASAVNRWATKPISKP
jgi:hypothetical protein